MPGDEGHARLRLVVTGRVQGVFFRRATAEEARTLRVKGWVRNLPDGSVEIVVEGKRSSLEILAAWAHLGPPAASVTSVDQQWSEFRNEFSGFRVR
jgi:acylphosphatase